MEIKKGMKFRCIKDVVMYESEEILYKKDCFYTSEKDGCITDNEGDTNHEWVNGDGSPIDIFSYHFETIAEEFVSFDLEHTFVHCTTQEEFERVIFWHNRKCHVWKDGKDPINKKAWNIYNKNTFVGLFIYYTIGDIFNCNNDTLVISFSQFERDFIIKDMVEEFENSFVPADVKSPQPIESSVKNDFKDGKLRWDLLPLDLIEELVKVYDYGAKKYYPESWKEIPDGYQRLKAASLRHLVAFEKGEENDPESGLPHLIQASWNLLTCYYYAKLKEKEE